MWLRCTVLVIVVISVLFVFFFKQKTAYDLRISDWSSDVCSSDLALLDGVRHGRSDDGRHARLHVGHVQGSHQELYHPGHGGVRVRVGALACSEPDYGYGHRVYAGDDPAPFDRYHDQRTGANPRSAGAQARARHNPRSKAGDRAAEISERKRVGTGTSVAKSVELGG